MTAATCRCGRAIPPRTGPGRPRTRCLICSPPEGPRRKPELVTATDAVEPGSGRLAAATAVELDAAGRSGTAAGVAALWAAEAVDAASGETGAGKAALLKAHREALTVALAGAARAADGLDELRDRRERKAAGA